MPLIYLTLSWIAGILFGKRFVWPVAAILAPTLFILLLFKPHHWKRLLLLSLCFIAFSGGGFYLQFRQPSDDDKHVQFYNGNGQVEINGMLSRDPEVGDKTMRLRLSVSNITPKEYEVSGNVLLIVPLTASANSTYKYGDVLRVTGKLEEPSKLDAFDYKGYLANQGIYSVMYRPKVETIGTDRGLKPLAWVYQLRGRLAETLTRLLPEPQASLAQGIVLGMRGNIPSSVNEEFVHTGTAHLLAISGVNLTIMAGILVSLGIWLFGRRHYIYVWLALIALWLYALITGFNPPVIRAAIMASLFLVAELLGRQSNAGIALVFAGAAMATINPQILGDASFQMSFMAMAGLILVLPSLQVLGKKMTTTWLGDRQGIAAVTNSFVDSFNVSLAALIAVWPLIAYYFGIVSWVGPLTTFLAIFAMPGIIISGGLAGVCGLFLLPLAQVIAWVSWLFLSYVLLVVNTFDKIPFSTIGSFDGKWIWIYYATIALVLWIVSNRIKFVEYASRFTAFATGLPLKRLTPGLLTIAVLVWLTAATMPDDKLQVDFLDVGQGDAILIQQGNQQILVDGGPSPQAIVSGLSRQMPFWDRTIDLLILTHPHSDHITGLLEVLKRYRVKQVLYVDSEYNSPMFDEWHNLLKEKNIKHSEAESGQQIKMGEVVIDILNPTKPHLSKSDSDIDNNGIVVRLHKGRVSFLLMADTQWEAEMDLLARRASLSSNVLKVGHHGSATSTTTAFLSVVNPDVAVISVGADNDFGHPDKDVVARLRDKVGEGNIYRTDEHGTIEFTTDGKKLWVNIEK